MKELNKTIKMLVWMDSKFLADIITLTFSSIKEFIINNTMDFLSKPNGLSRESLSLILIPSELTKMNLPAND